jgi:sulfhydrogenase subunit delta
MEQKKPRVAFFDFSCCEGCQLTVLQMEEELLAILDLVEIVTWREVMTGESDVYDIAFCEGSIASNRDMERIKKIRQTAATLVALGSCASIGCHNALKNRRSERENLDLVYGKGVEFDTIPARPIAAVVRADYRIHGCPVSLPEFRTVFKYILSKRQYDPPNQPVCVECKLRDNLCVYERGLICLGPVTRCGCNAICTTYGDACQGCRGLMESANIKAAVKVLTGEKLHAIMDQVAKKFNLTEMEIREKFAVYNDWPGGLLQGV